MAIRVGRWNCEACGNIGNLGPKTQCEKCGSPRPANVKFYLADDSEVVTNQEEVRKAKAGADWVCSYCSGHNKVYETKCTTCGNTRNASDGDESLPQSERRLDQRTPPPPPPPKSRKDAPRRTASQQPGKKKMGWGKKILLILIAAIVGFVILAQLSSETEVTVSGHAWQTTVEYTENKLVEESDWKLPPGATLISSSNEIHHYNSIPDGYETRTRTKKVQVGTEKVKVSERNLGNGHFEDVYENKPVYEERTEEYKEQIYRKEPVYQTKYKYSLFKWIKQEPLYRLGDDKAPEWNPKVDSMTNVETYKITKQRITYFLKIIGDDGKEQKESVSEAFWQSYEEGDVLKAEKSLMGGDYSKLEELNHE